VEMPFFLQELFDLAQSLLPGPNTPQPAFGGMTYNQALDIDHDAGVNGIDLALSMFNVDAIATPTGTPVWPTDLINGDNFDFGTSFSEPTLIRLAAGFEHATHARIVPQFFPTLPRNNVSGVPLPRRRSAPGHGKHNHRHHHCL